MGFTYRLAVSGCMTNSSDEFDPESPEEREVAGEAAGDRADFLSLMGHAYRGELGRTTAWRTRIDRTTNWAVVLTASLLTWAFSGDSRPHYILLLGVVMDRVGDNSGSQRRNRCLRGNKVEAAFHTVKRRGESGSVGDDARCVPTQTRLQ